MNNFKLSAFEFKLLFDLVIKKFTREHTDEETSYESFLNWKQITKWCGHNLQRNSTLTSFNHTSLPEAFEEDDRVKHFLSNQKRENLKKIIGTNVIYNHLKHNRIQDIKKPDDKLNPGINPYFTNVYLLYAGFESIAEFRNFISKKNLISSTQKEHKTSPPKKFPRWIIWFLLVSIASLGFIYRGSISSFFSTQDPPSVHIILLPFVPLASHKDQDRQFHWALKSRLDNFIKNENLDIEVTVINDFHQNPTLEQIRNITQKFGGDIAFWGSYQEYVDINEVSLDFDYFVLNQQIANNIYDPLDKVRADKYSAIDNLANGKLTGGIEEMIFWTMCLEEVHAGKFMESKKYLDKIQLKDNEKYAKAHEISGFIHYNLKDNIKAYESYKVAYKYNPDDIFVLNNLGVFARLLDKDYEALKYMNKALDLDSNYAKGYTTRGNIHYKQENFELAIKDYTSALKLNSKDDKTLYNRAYLYYENEEYYKSLSDIERAIQINNKDDDFYELRDSINLILRDKRKTKFDKIEDIRK